MDGRTALLWTPLTLGSDLDTELIPIVRSVPRTEAERRHRRHERGAGTGTGESAAAGPAIARPETGQPGTGARSTRHRRSRRSWAARRFRRLRRGRRGQGGGGSLPNPARSSDHPRVARCLQPFLGEPKAGDLGPTGAAIVTHLEQIAYALQMDTCDYAGHFLLRAAAVLGQRARQVGLSEVTEVGVHEVAPATGDKSVSLRFHPPASPLIQLMRHLATVVPQMSEASRMVADALYANPRVITSSETAVSWRRRFLKEFAPAMDDSIADLFKLTCRVIFLQMLNTSRQAIEARRQEPGFSRFADMFERVVVPQLEDIDELTRLRERLQAAPGEAAAANVNTIMSRAFVANVPGAQAGQPAPSLQPHPSSWHEAISGVQEALAPRARVSGGAAAPNAYETFSEHGVWKIRDRRGRVWTLGALEQAITMARGSVESVEPLVQQLTDLPEVMQRFHNPQGGVRAELRRVLDEMSLENWRVTLRAQSDPDMGFEASSIDENVETATVPYTSYALHGIHAQAHAQLGEFFRGDRFYGRGIDYLFSSELGMRSLVGFGEFVGLVILAVVCAPAAIAVGIDVAAYHYEQARERESIYHALIDPNQVLSWAEVEADLFAAELGLALSFVPLAGELMGELRPLIGVAARETAEVGSEAAAAGGRTVLRSALREVLDNMRSEFVSAFILELGQAWTISTGFELAMKPLLERRAAETSATGPVGRNGACTANRTCPTPGRSADWRCTTVTDLVIEIAGEARGRASIVEDARVLTDFADQLAAREHIDPAEAKRLVGSLVVSTLIEIGGRWAEEMSVHVEAIFRIRDDLRVRYRRAVDLFSGRSGPPPAEIPPELQPEALRGLFNDLFDHIQQLKGPEEWARGQGRNLEGPGWSRPRT